MTLDWSDSDAPDRGVYRGHAGWRAFVQARDEALGSRGFETIELLTPRPDTVVLVGRVRERGRTSGAEVAAQGAAVFQLRDGKVDPGSPGPACLAGIVARMSGRPIATLAALACAASPAGACGTAASVHHAPARPDPILVRSAPDGTTAATAPPSGPPAPRPSPAVPQPPIHRWPIPFGAARKREMAAYSLRHYGEHTYLLRAPKVIVEHYTETATAQQAYNTFAPDVPDSEFGQLPNTCAHFLVEPSGKIDQLVSLSLRCRHTVGLNWTAIGIEHVGFSDREILERPRQLAASLALTRWLRCHYGIAAKNVIGHNESLSSPYHHELVPAFQHQTHSDFNHADMQRYRALLARLPCA